MLGTRVFGLSGAKLFSTKTNIPRYEGAIPVQTYSTSHERECRSQFIAIFTSRYHHLYVYLVDLKLIRPCPVRLINYHGQAVNKKCRRVTHHSLQSKKHPLPRAALSQGEIHIMSKKKTRLTPTHTSLTVKTSAQTQTRKKKAKPY